MKTPFLVKHIWLSAFLIALSSLLPLIELRKEVSLRSQQCAREAIDYLLLQRCQMYLQHFVS